VCLWQLTDSWWTWMGFHGWDEVLKRTRSSKLSRTWTEMTRILDKGPESIFSVLGSDLEMDLKRGFKKENPSLGTWNKVLKEKTRRSGGRARCHGLPSLVRFESAILGQLLFRPVLVSYWVLTNVGRVFVFFLTIDVSGYLKIKKNHPSPGLRNSKKGDYEEEPKIKVCD
jgi:hypothetical protein